MGPNSADRHKGVIIGSALDIDTLGVSNETCDAVASLYPTAAKVRDENARLKRLVADQALHIQVLKEVNGKKW